MKTLLTCSIEYSALKKFAKQGTFICKEVGISTYEDIEKKYGQQSYIYHKKNTEIVDILSWNTKNEYYCYEIKTSKSDFNSKCKKSFVGNYNYYLMPIKLYEQVKDKIPSYVGVYTTSIDCIDKIENILLSLQKKAKRQEIKVDKDIMMYSLMKSLYREQSNYNQQKLDYITRENSKLKKKLKDIELRNIDLLKKINNKDYCPNCEYLKSNLKLERKINERLRKQIDE